MKKSEVKNRQIAPKEFFFFNLGKMRTYYRFHGKTMRNFGVFPKKKRKNLHQFVLVFFQKNAKSEKGKKKTTRPLITVPVIKFSPATRLIYTYWVSVKHCTSAFIYYQGFFFFSLLLCFNLFSQKAHFFLHTHSARIFFFLLFSPFGEYLFLNKNQACRGVILINKPMPKRITLRFMHIY